jgi:uncharacterized protein YndB with AHSA1/START domain
MLHKYIGAEVREFVSREYEGKMAQGVVASRVYNTSVEDLWDAVTNPERLPRWFAPVTGELRKGGRYQVQGNAGGSITRCDAPTAFDLTWEFGGGMSWVTVRLAPEGQGTRLTLEHIAHVDAMKEHWDKYGPGATGVGWDLGLLGLGLYIDSGSQKPPETDPAWMASEEAKAFMRGSAESWARAHVAGGETPDVAHGMAARTAAFYTGG